MVWNVYTFTNLQRAVVVSDFIKRSIGLIQCLYELYDVIGHQSLTNVVIVR